MFLNNLAGGLGARYGRTGDLKDLEEAIGHLRRAVRLTPEGSPDLPGFLSNLALGLTSRYERTGGLKDLEEAISHLRRAVRLTPEGSPDFPRFLNNLALGLRVRYERTGNLKDLEEAISHWEQAVRLAPEGSPDLPGFLNNLAGGLRARYERSGDPKDLDAAIDRWEQAMGRLDEAFLISPVAYQRGQQERWAGLYAHAVSAYLQAGHPAKAAAIAEGFKSRILATLLGRGDLPAPPTVPPPLVEREQDLASRLTALDTAAYQALGQSSLRGEAATTRLPALEERREIVAQLQALWQKMTSYGEEAAGYVALRRGDRPAWKDLARLARALGSQTALLSLFSTREKVLLFLLHAQWNEPRVVEVDLSGKDLRYCYWANYEEEVLNRPRHQATGRSLTHRWRSLGQPLLAPALPHLEGVNHLVIAPEGLFHLLPLHALDLDGRGTTLLDRFSVSYVPALGILERLLKRAPVEKDEAVVLGYTPRGQEQGLFLGEAKAVAAQMGVPPLLDGVATGANLRKALQGRTLRMVHLSCHGRFNPAAPLQSGVLLGDGLFTARKWMTLRFRADLVTLSACQTGLVGHMGGDELAGLSQALLYAGASSLLLGLWSVNAVTTAHLMMDFYRRLWDGTDRKRTDKATALREATLALRDGALLPPEIQEQIDTADPYYWAPFILVGDWR